MQQGPHRAGPLHNHGTDPVREQGAQALPVNKTNIPTFSKPCSKSCTAAKRQALAPPPPPQGLTEYCDGLPLPRGGERRPPATLGRLRAQVGAATRHCRYAHNHIAHARQGSSRMMPYGTCM
eukprot:scaffold239133_cov40-Tisochrysis_lutea.AAC.1